MTETVQLAHSLIGPAAIAPITDRAFLRITGPDATRWLNGMVTNNIKDLAPGQGNYNFLLNAQGRIQGDCTIYREPHEGDATFLLETDISQLETVHQTLDRFIIMDDVELDTAILGEQGYLVFSENALVQLSNGTHMAQISVYDSPVIMLTPSSGGIPRYESFGTKSALEQMLQVKHLPHLSSETLEALRILESRPKFGIDIRDRDLPQETAQTHALHFAKGCYLGQEIVERIRSRGQVHRTFTQFTLTGDLPTLPAPLTANEKPVGELTSAARIGDRIFALGTIRREALDTHQPITYPGGTANPKS